MRSQQTETDAQNANRIHRLIPKEDRKKIHEYLFKEGVLVAKKDYNLPEHPDLKIKNLFVRHTL